MRGHFTSESVSEGHPDKLADQMSDAIVDEAFKRAGDRAHEVRCACETLVKGDLLVVAGEMRNVADAQDYVATALRVAKEVGYGDPALGFDPDSCQKVCAITEQSPEIAMGVDAAGAKGAGDQGIMFGYACDETAELMPLAISLAHRLMRRQAQLRKSGHGWLGPDAKSQVTVLYEDGAPKAVTDVVLSTQHTERIDGADYQDVIHERVAADIIEPVLAKVEHDGCRHHINPTGKFVLGGPQADAGLTGRKIIVDTYGGSAPHGGGAFSGKDPSKVDRSAAYAARYIAKNVVAAGLAIKCLVQLSYAIGEDRPVSVMVDTFSTATVDEGKIASYVMDGALLDLSPSGIIDGLGLVRPIYRKTAAYGHFGRDDVDPPFPWEDVSNAASLGRQVAG